eukprot:8682060-Heterocapsa_arctica.AAC.1
MERSAAYILNQTQSKGRLITCLPNTVHRHPPRTGMHRVLARSKRLCLVASVRASMRSGLLRQPRFALQVDPSK